MTSWRPLRASTAPPSPRAWVPGRRPPRARPPPPLASRPSFGAPPVRRRPPRGRLGSAAPRTAGPSRVSLPPTRGGGRLSTTPFGGSGLLQGEGPYVQGRPLGQVPRQRRCQVPHLAAGRLHPEARQLTGPAQRTGNNAASATTTPGRQTMAGLKSRLRSSWRTLRSAISRTRDVGASGRVKLATANAGRVKLARRMPAGRPPPRTTATPPPLRMCTPGDFATVPLHCVIVTIILTIMIMVTPPVSSS